MLSLFRSHPPKFTLLITALCLLIYAWTSFIDWEYPTLMLQLNFPENAEQQQDYWRYFSHSLVHLSLPHIAFNLSFWWLFGGAIEKKLGSLTLILIYFASAVISGFMQNWASGAWFFGLSGVVYAVMGFVFILDKFSSIKFDLPDGFLMMIFVGIAFGFISPFVGIEMGNAAHISGLIVGIMFGFFTLQLGKIRKLG